MADIVHDEFQTPLVVDAARAIVLDVNGKDPDALAEAILKWLREHTRFINDPLFQQRLDSPQLLLQKIARDDVINGNCVDLAMLAASLVMAVGIPAEFIAEAYDVTCDPQKSPLVHVYAIAQTQFGWVDFDTQQEPDGQRVTPCRRMRLPLV
jgi:transglutaminase-like putative cysteine protease